MPAPETRRLFFALWPDNDGVERLAHAAKMAQAVCGGRPTRRENLHLTLAFLGGVPLEKIDALRAMAAAVRAEAHELRLDRLGMRRRQRIVWAACEAAPPQLASLVLALQQGLRGMGMVLEERAFTSHVTLLRNVHESDLGSLPALETIGWPVSEFVLAESQLAASGASYRIIGRWPLAAGDPLHPPAAG